MLEIHRVDSLAGRAALSRLEARGETDLARVEPDVREIISAVRQDGDTALIAYAQRFRGKAPDALILREFGGRAALARLKPDARQALELAAERIRAFHKHQLDPGFEVRDVGITLGTRVLPVERVGVYAPGGKARYPSSVLMSAIPAHVAGVPEIVLATPLAGDETDDSLFAAAYLSGVTAIVDAGGAEAIAALAYGTASVPRVDKIVGPGNIYVACAKRLVFGAVSIDGIAGPTEILVLADDSADPRAIAADLLSQAEHDEAAYPLLACLADEMAEAVRVELGRQLETLPRRKIAEAALAGQGQIFVVPSRERLVEIANRIGAEHVAAHVVDPGPFATRIRRAGAIFLGGLTPEAAGDYLAGPSHVLPTGGAVRFGAPLGVYDFVMRSSVIQYDRAALEAQSGAICALARLEGLEAHARAVEIRCRRSEAAGAE